MSDMKWTLEELSKHLEINSKDPYSMAVPLAALYKKLYGQFPHFGLSGQQAEFANAVFDMLPDPENHKPQREVRSLWSESDWERNRRAEEARTRKEG